MAMVGMKRSHEVTVRWRKSVESLDLEPVRV